MAFARRYYQNAEDGSTRYFRRWCAIGPEFTRDPNLAARFETEREAATIVFSMAPMVTIPHPLDNQEETP